MVLILTGGPAAAAASGQLLPPPGDRDVRAVYWELRGESEVWLTLEAKSAKGAAAPLLTFTFRFSGRKPAAPPAQVEIRAYAGALWAPRTEFWILIDDERKIDLGGTGRAFGLTSGTPSDYLAEPISVATLRQMAGARRVSGNALGFDFELNAAQRGAINVFLERCLSPNPVGLPARLEWSSGGVHRQLWRYTVATGR